MSADIKFTLLMKETEEIYSIHLCKIHNCIKMTLQPKRLVLVN